MLILVQFPVVDARRFIASPTGRLRRPTWPTPAPLPLPARQLHRPGIGAATSAAVVDGATPVHSQKQKIEYDFVRSFGAVRKRRAGPIAGWPGEWVYCDLRNLVRFRQRIPGVLYRDPQGNTLRATAVHRRFFTDGRATARFEIGLTLRWRGPLWKSGRTRGYEIAQERIPPETMRAAIRAILETSVGMADHTTALEVPNQRPFLETPLAAAGPELATALLHASTAMAQQPVEDWWLSVGDPVVFVAYQSTELERLPDSVLRLKLFASASDSMPADAPTTPGTPPVLTPVPAADEWRPTVGIDTAPVHEERAERVWYIGQTGSGPQARDAARRARVHLMRLASEAASLKQILRLIDLERIRLVRSQEPGDLSDRLQRYLADAAGLLLHKHREGLDNDTLFNALIASIGTFPIDDPDSVLTKVRDARRIVKMRVDGYVKKVITYHWGDIVNQKQTIRAGDGSPITGVVQQHAGGNATANVHATATISPQMSEQLELLRGLVDQLRAAPGLAADDKEVATHHFEALEAEIKKPKPNPKWYNISGEGLIAAAKSVTGLAGPIAAAVAKIATMLA